MTRADDPEEEISVLILRRGRRRPLLVNAETGPFAGARGLPHFVTFHFDLGLTSPFPFPSQGPWTTTSWFDTSVPGSIFDFSSRQLLSRLEAHPKARSCLASRRRGEWRERGKGDLRRSGTARLAWRRRGSPELSKDELEMTLSGRDVNEIWAKLKADNLPKKDGKASKTAPTQRDEGNERGGGTKERQQKSEDN